MNSSDTDLPPCPLSGRPLVPGPAVNEHHLVPRAFGGRETVRMHRICHSKIHSVFTDEELRDRYCTLARLKAHPEDRQVRALGAPEGPGVRRAQPHQRAQTPAVKYR